MITLMYRDHGVIGGIVIDATISENHKYSNSVTKFNVESGFNITDHVQKENATLTMEGIITNNSIVEDKSQYVKQLYRGRMRNTYAALIALAGHRSDKLTGSDPYYLGSNQAKPQIINVITDLRTWANCVISDLDIKQSDETGCEAFSFTAVIERINIVGLLEYELPELIDETTNAYNQTGTTNVGDASSKKATNDEISTLKKGANAIGLELK